MALIKCSECGKEFSDRANACPNCACPVEQKTQEPKDVQEREILSVKLDLDKINKVRKIFLILGIIFAAPGLFFLSMPPLTILFFFYGGIFFFIYWLYKKIEENTLTLTNKRLKGSINMLFTTTDINIPLERIDNIVVNKTIASTGIVIMSNNLRKGVGYVANADEFVDTTIKEIEKYKNR